MSCFLSYVNIPIYSTLCTKGSLCFCMKVCWPLQRHNFSSNAKLMEKFQALTFNRKDGIRRFCTKKIHSILQTNSFNICHIKSPYIGSTTLHKSSKHGPRTNHQINMAIMFISYYIQSRSHQSKIIIMWKVKILS